MDEQHAVIESFFHGPKRPPEIVFIGSMKDCQTEAAWCRHRNRSARYQIKTKAEAEKICNEA